MTLLCLLLHMSTAAARWWGRNCPTHERGPTRAPPAPQACSAGVLQRQHGCLCVYNVRRAINGRFLPLTSCVFQSEISKVCVLIALQTRQFFKFITKMGGLEKNDDSCDNVL
jgi:hypothetical protein